MIRLIILIIIVIAVLSYFGVSVRSIVESGVFRENFSYAWNSGEYLWNNHLAGPARYIWYDIFMKVIWASFIENMERMREGKDMRILENAPSVNFGNAGE